MSVREEVRRRRRLDEPDFDAEQEVDVGEAWGKITRRWWLPAAGLALGIALGYLLSLGGGSFYRAEALVYVGQPVAPGAATAAVSLATHPDIVGEIVRSEGAIAAAAQRSGMTRNQLRGNIATQSIVPPLGRRLPTQNPLYEISVEGTAARRVSIAANLLAQRVVSELSPYVDVRIRTYEARLESLEASINAVTASITALQDTIDEARRENTFTGLQRLELISQLANDETRRAQLVANQSDNLQLLEFARNIERPRIIEEAVPRQTTARSVRNSALVGGLIGLILGTLAALLADRFAGRGSRRIT